MMGVFITRNGTLKPSQNLYAEHNGVYVQANRAILHQNGVWTTIYSLGSGTVDDPYLVRTVDELKSINNNPAAHYALDNDLTIPSGFPMFIPMCASTPFTGSFDGRGHKITVGYNFTDVETEYGKAKGLFAVNEGTIKNLRMKLSMLGIGGTGDSEGKFSGAIAAVNNGIISRCDVEHTGSYYAPGYTGVIAGMNTADGLIEDCYTDTRLHSPISYYDAKWNGPFGGVVGINYGNIRHCIIYSVPYYSGYNQFAWLTNTNAAGGDIRYCVLIRLDSMPYQHIVYRRGLDMYVSTATRPNHINQANYPTFDFNNVWVMGSNGPRLRA